MRGHEYTADEILFLADNVVGRSYADLTALFNTRFGLSLSQLAIEGTITRCKLANGFDGRFKPGLVPHNKGIKGVSYPGMKATQFKPGQLPTKYLPVGAETMRDDRYIWVKVADPKTWRQKHVMIWEAAHGPRPAGHAVIFGDGNRQNFDLSNLILVSRAELAVMNKFGLIGSSTELTEAGKSVADLRMRIIDRQKGRRKKCNTID